MSAGPRLDNGKNAISVVEFRKGFSGLWKSSPACGIAQGECGSWACVTFAFCNLRAVPMHVGH